MVKLTFSIFIAVLPVLALASANWDVQTRAISENDVFGRELSEAETIVFARDIEELFTRMPQGFSQDESQELVSRGVSKKVRSVAKVIGKVIRKVAGLIIREDEAEMFVRDVDVREFDELYERDLELEDLELREFGGWEIEELD